MKDCSRKSYVSREAVGDPTSTRLKGATLRFIVKSENGLPNTRQVDKREPGRPVAKTRSYAGKGVGLA
jgi:hypothetical protein